MLEKLPEQTIDTNLDDDEIQLQQMRSALRKAEARPYFQEERDHQDRLRYYRNLAEDLSPRQMYEQLSALLKKSHMTRLPYKPSAQLYPFVDLQPNRKLLSIYSQREYEPEELILADLQIQRRIAQQARAALLAESLNLTQLASRIALLEADAQFNCEHVVPQSWFKKRDPMRGDLHHLFACEIDCNSYRANTPYFDFRDFDQAPPSVCGKSDQADDGGPGFEPAGGKGAVARAVLYFLVRYPGESQNLSRRFRASRLSILLKWHREFPPGLYERHRNQAIFDVQGNRNPLIDFPGIAEKIDFRMGLGG